MVSMRLQTLSLVATALCLLRVSYPSDALAQGPAADALFKEAREAFDAGDYATACPKFEEVVRIKPGLGARIALGHCYRERGDLVRALEVYEAVVADAPNLEAKAATPKDKTTVKDRARTAQENISTLRERVGTFTIEVPAAQITQPGFFVHLDGSPLPTEKFGKSMWILPGKHRIEASATGFLKDVREIDVLAKGTYTVVIELVPEKPAVEPPRVSTELETAKPPPVDTGPSPVTSGTTTSPEVQTPKPGTTAPPKVQTPEVGMSSARTPMWAWVAGGLGLGALAVGTVFVVPYMNTRDAIAADCSDGTCVLPGLASKYETQWNNSVAMMAGFWSAGAIGVGVCLAGVLGARQNAPRDAMSVGFVPWANRHDGGLLVHGSF